MHRPTDVARPANKPLVLRSDRAMIGGVGTTSSRSGDHMTATFASGALVVLGILFAVLGLLSGGGIPLMLIGLAAIAVGGIIGLAARRTA